MKKTHAFFIAGLLLLLVVAADLAYWISLFSAGRSFAEGKAIYLSRFPVGWRNPVLLTLTGCAMMVASIACFNKSRREQRLNVVSRILLVSSLVLLFWLAFTLM